MTFPFDGTINDSVDRIFEFLNYKELSLAAKVCKNWHFMANSKRHWKNLLGLITDYRHTTEHPKQTYQKILDLQSKSERIDAKFQKIAKKGTAAEVTEFCKSILQTPSVVANCSYPFIGEIARKYPELIVLIAQDAKLSELLRKDIRTFLQGLSNTFLQGNSRLQQIFYPEYIKLLANNDKNLLEVIHQDPELANLLKRTSLPQPKDPVEHGSMINYPLCNILSNFANR